MTGTWFKPLHSKLENLSSAILMCPYYLANQERYGVLRVSFKQCNKIKSAIILVMVEMTAKFFPTLTHIIIIRRPLYSANTSIYRDLHSSLYVPVKLQFPGWVQAMNKMQHVNKLEVWCNMGIIKPHSIQNVFQVCWLDQCLRKTVFFDLES